MQATPLPETNPCTASDCRRDDGMPCSYIDRRGRRCQTAWCPAHQVVIEDQVLCRRHAGIVRAMGADVIRRKLAPDIGTRAPALVNWVCNDLDDRVLKLLAEQIQPGTSDQLSEERTHLVVAPEQTRRWDRSWLLLGETGVELRITVSVEEINDRVVDVWLDQDLLASVVPPWVDRNLRKVSVSAAQDAAEREAFYDHLMTVIIDAVRSVRRSSALNR